MIILILTTYIANHSKWKNFAVVELNCNLLENIHGCTAVLYGQAQEHYHYFTGSVLRSPTKTNFSASNDLQYMVYTECSNRDY